jgi:hypothetical protein
VASCLRFRTTVTCAFAAAIFVLGCGGASAASGGANAVPHEWRQDVVRIILRPFLLGKSPLVAVRAPKLWRGAGTIISLRSIEKAIPNALPLPPPQPICRAIKVSVTVVTPDEQRLTYGPCAAPDSIHRLRWAMYRVATRDRLTRAGDEQQASKKMNPDASRRRGSNVAHRTEKEGFEPSMEAFTPITP